MFLSRLFSTLLLCSVVFSACAKGPDKLSPEAEALQASALKRQESGDVASAIELWQRLLAIEPDCAPAHYNLGLGYQDAGKLPIAEREYRATLKLDPDFADAHNNLALVLLELNKLDEALAHAQSAVALSPESAQFQYNLGLVQHHRKDFGSAIQTYGAALRLDPKMYLAVYNIGKIRSVRGERKQAIELYKQAFEINPDFVDAAYNTAYNYHEMGYFTEAREWYKQVLKKNPAYPNAAENNRALSENIKLRDKFARSLKAGISPIERAAHFHTQGFLADAEQWYLSAAEKDPADIRATANLAHVYLMQKRWPESIQLYDKATAIDPGNLPLKQGRDQAQAGYNEALSASIR